MAEMQKSLAQASQAIADAAVFGLLGIGAGRLARAFAEERRNSQPSEGTTARDPIASEYNSLRMPKVGAENMRNIGSRNRLIEELAKPGSFK